MSANERTFQGELYRMMNGILSSDESILFSKITQEENVGSTGMARFADGKLYSRNDLRKVTSFELKNTKWDATDDILVRDAATKAMNNGYEYFVTGTPRQLVVYKTFEPGVPLTERKLKIYYLSNARNDDEVLTQSYETEITPKLQEFLAELSDIVHGVREVHWDSIDRFFVNKLSAYILESSAEMLSPMYEKISSNKKFRDALKDYLQSQDIFNVSLKFDREDVYKICQLTNYLLYLKVIFYSYLQREVPSLRLKPLEIPEDTDLLNRVLRDRFNDVLKHDFELIFSKTILDKFEFNQNYIPVFKDNIEQIKTLDFKQLTADIVGEIYNTLIDNQEQHDRGQHFTNTNEVDIVNAFCIKEDTKYVLDSGCGAGTFLVRAYFLLRHFRQDLTHEELLERIWGIEIATFPAFLAVMNLSLLNIKAKENYPVIIKSDFAKIDGTFTYSGYFLNANMSFTTKNLGDGKKEVALPEFDACVGNPPYIMQELIEDKAEWGQLANKEFGIVKINQQSDLYVYFLIHTAAFLKEGGRLGYVISASWLDVSFGAEVQKFLLDHFKIIAIIDQQKSRSFATASINTVILIIEKCSDRKMRERNRVKFVRVFSDYEDIIGRSNDANRFETTRAFARRIEEIEADEKGNDLQVETVSQEHLEGLSTTNGKYQNGYWGANFLRATEIFKTIRSHSEGKFVPLSEIADVQYGIKTGANKFFYLVDETHVAKSFGDEAYLLEFGVPKYKHDLLWESCGWFRSELTGEHFVIEREYVRPLFKTQKEASNLDIVPKGLKYHVLMCSDSKDSLIARKKHVLKYLNVGESRPHEIPKIQSVSGRNPWYDLTSSAHAGDFIFPSKIGETYRLIDNRGSQVYCDKVNYVITVKEPYREYVDEVFLILNSISFRYFIDLFSRQLTGNQTLSDVDVNLVEKTPILRPDLFRKNVADVDLLVGALKSREQGTISQEVQMKDRREIDSAIFQAIGLTEEDVSALYTVAINYVRSRQEKSDSLKTSKKKQKLGYDDAVELVNDRYADVRKYKDLVKGSQLTNFTIPEGKAAYPRNGIGEPNLFGAYPLYFKDSKSVRPLEFSSPEQFELFEFLNRVLGIQSQALKLPENPDDCRKVLRQLRDDFKNNENQIKIFLKSNRSSANHLSIYRDLILAK